MIKELALNIVKLSDISYLEKDVSEAYLFSAGIYTKKGDLERIYDGLNLKVVDSIGNISLHFENNVCENLYRTKKFFDVTSQNIVHISCNHSTQSKKSIFLDCQRFEYLNTIEICDIVLVLINQHLENNGALSFIVSPFEKILILFYRKLKLKFPKIVRRCILKLKKIIGGKFELQT